MGRCSPTSRCYRCYVWVPLESLAQSMPCVRQLSGLSAQQVGQRKFVLLFLFMATQGGGVVSGKLIMAAARRLRVT